MALRTDIAVKPCAHRGAILHFRSDPGPHDDPGSFEFFEDGLLVTDDGRVAALGPARELLRTLPTDAQVIEHGDNILMPGFVDAHIHYPQTDIIGSGGRQLLDWLENYTFPTEGRFSDPAHAQEVAEFFLDELVRNGTTTAMVFCSVHRASVQAFFQAAAARRMRMVAGKVLMDRNCPEYLRDSPAAGERDSRELLEAWHRRERLLYAINLDVYDRYGLLRDRAIYAHCIHFDQTDRARMAQSGASAAFCPSSNLHLGSGLFDMAAADAAGMRFSIATDVAGGSSFSMLQTLAAAYNVAQLSHQHLSPLRAFYLGTLGGARALGVDGQVGRFTVGAEADFIVLDLRATALIARRTARSRTLTEKLLVLMTLGDDRVVSRTYVLGREARAAASRRLPPGSAP